MHVIVRKHFSRFLVLFLFLASSAAAQGFRFDAQITQQATVAGVTNVVTIPTSAQVAFCNFPANATPCTNKAVTYTSQTLVTPCSTSTQIVLTGTTSCVASPDAQENWGVWVPAGTYAYTITLPGGVNLGPYIVTLFPPSTNYVFTGNDTFKNINRVRLIDFANLSAWAGADACAWINSAITDIGAGVLGTVDARGLAGGTSTCTSGTITVPQNITLLLSGTINTNANPGISVTGGTVAGGVSSAIIGTGRFNTLFQCTATTGSFCVSIGDGTNIMRGFTLSDMKIIADLGGGLGGSTIRIRDGANHLTVRNLQLGPVQSCVVFETGAIGQQFQTWDSVRCDGFSGIGFNADLTAGVGGTNLKLSNVYMNASGSTTGTTGFDIRKWVGVTIDTSDTDGNGASGPTVGFKLAGVGGTGTFTVNGTGCETMQAGTICISVVGPGSYTFTSPYIISCAQLIDVSAQSSVTIENPFSSATSGGNDIIFQAGASGGTYAVFGGSTTMSKPTILANGGTLFQQFLGPKWGQQQLFSGTQALPGLAGAVGTTNGFYETAGGIGYSRGGNVKAAFDASGTLDQFEINGSSAGLAFCPAGLFGNSCDNFIRRTAAGALVFGNGPANSNGALTLGSVISTTANPATAGMIELASADAIDWRNNANTANLALAKSATDVISWGGIPSYVFVTADFTTAANTNLQTITGLTWTMPANEAFNIPFSCHLMYSQATAAVADQFGIQDVTVAPTNISAKGEIGTSAAAITLGNLPTLTTTTATAIVTFTPSVITTVWNANITGFIEQPSNASTSAINIMVQTSNSADLVTVKRGSFCRVF